MKRTIDVIDLTSVKKVRTHDPIKDEAIMFALFSFKVLMGENKMRKSIIGNSNEIYFPEKSGNKGTFATMNYINWEIKLKKYLTQISLQGKHRDIRWVMSVITPPANPNEGSHYLSLVIDIKRKKIYTYDSLLNSKDSSSILNNYELYTVWEPIKTELQKWANSNDYKYYYLVSPIAWQNTENEQDAWCQTWALLFQKKITGNSKKFRNPKNVAKEQISLNDSRKTLMKLVQTMRNKEFERELESEFQAQLKLHKADPNMKKYTARELINDAAYRHFFEPY